MTTKEQERNALSKIQKVLAEVDKDGWVYVAFRGVVEDARMNIDNDFACSYFDRYNDSMKKIQQMAARIQELGTENEKLIMVAEKEKARSSKMVQTIGRMRLGPELINQIRVNVTDKENHLHEELLKAVNESGDSSLPIIAAQIRAVADFSKRFEAFVAAQEEANKSRSM